MISINISFIRKKKSYSELGEGRFEQGGGQFFLLFFFKEDGMYL